MKLGFRLVRIKFGRKAKIYSIKYDGEENHEFHKFVTNPEVRDHPDFEALRKKIKELYDKRGLLPQYFRPEDEKSIHSEICRIDYGVGYLRLFCIRWNDNLLILGGGGVKPNDIRFWQESLELSVEARKVTDVFHRLKRYLEESGLTIEDLL
ncbi:MAG: hypothetical protein COT43_02175 [Candidatus Marinimicrobia bacterium CG08_land_8_20_14_0_20_45_22]|nr:MAG: hypothetical protein COT43_02175 [Candidatus Marinimicrobia bacterium CG08_land_8_20_14_0_20_45_22]